MHKIIIIAAVLLISGCSIKYNNYQDEYGSGRPIGLLQRF